MPDQIIVKRGSELKRVGVGLVGAAIVGVVTACSGGLSPAAVAAPAPTATPAVAPAVVPLPATRTPTVSAQPARIHTTGNFQDGNQPTPTTVARETARPLEFYRYSDMPRLTAPLPGSTRPHRAPRLPS